MLKTLARTAHNSVVGQDGARQLHYGTGYVQQRRRHLLSGTQHRVVAGHVRLLGSVGFAVEVAIQVVVVHRSLPALQQLQHIPLLAHIHIPVLVRHKRTDYSTIRVCPCIALSHVHMHDAHAQTVVKVHVKSVVCVAGLLTLVGKVLRHIGEDKALDLKPRGTAPVVGFVQHEELPKGDSVLFVTHFAQILKHIVHIVAYSKYPVLRKVALLLWAHLPGAYGLRNLVGIVLLEGHILLLARAMPGTGQGTRLQLALNMALVSGKRLIAVACARRGTYPMSRTHTFHVAHIVARAKMTTILSSVGCLQ